MASSTAAAYTDLTWPWRWSHPNKLGELLSSGFKSDFTLLLGPAKEKVPVHKIFLQFVSPVLNSRVGKCSAAQLAIENVDPVIFKLLLKYAYTGDSGMTIIQALPLLKMATEFEIFPLADQCAALLKSDLTLENVLPLFQGAMEYAHGELIQSTLSFICKNGDKVLVLDDFKNLRLECLIEIIQQDDLEVLDEVNIFNALICWGEAEQARTPQPAEQRTVLNKALAHVRFPLMDPKTFSLVVATKNVLDASELTSILTSFYTTSDQISNDSLPQSRFPSSPRAGVLLDGDLILSREKRPYAYDVNVPFTECLMISCDTTIVLKGFTIPHALFTLITGSTPIYYPDLLRAHFSVISGNSVEIRDSLPFGDLVDGVGYQTKINPPLRLPRKQPTYLTVRITGKLGYQHNGYAKKDWDFDTQRIMITRFSDFVQSPENSECGLVIRRKDRDTLPMTSGLIEKLIFGRITSQGTL